VELDEDLMANVDAAVAKLFEDRLGPDIEADARRYAPVGPSWGYDPAHPRVPAHQGGEMRDGIEHHMEGKSLIISAPSPAAYVEMGTPPHEITAHGPWSLWSPVTDERFGRSVHHPGTKPQPFLRSALYQVRGEDG
jgi:hypothetical protein